MPRYYKDRIFDEDAKADLGSLAELAAGKAESENYDRYLKYHSGGNLTTNNLKMASARPLSIVFFHKSIKIVIYETRNSQLAYRLFK